MIIKNESPDTLVIATGYDVYQVRVAEMKGKE